MTLSINKLINMFLIIIYLSSIASASINETNTCKELNVDNEYYLLTRDVESSGTCFNIAANNITLDGAGHYVNFSNLTNGAGVYIYGHNNVTVKDIIVFQLNKSILLRNGITFTNSSSNGLVLNATVNSEGEAIQFRFNSNDNTVINSTGISNQSVGIFLTSSNNSRIISSTGISDILNYRVQPGIGVYLSNNITILNSTGVSESYVGIQISSCLNSTFINNTGISNLSHGIQLQSFSDNNILINNIGISNINYGIQILQSSGNIFESNAIQSNIKNEMSVVKSSNNTIINLVKLPVITVSVSQNSLNNNSTNPTVLNNSTETILLLIMLLLIFIFFIMKK